MHAARTRAARMRAARMQRAQRACSYMVRPQLCCCWKNQVKKALGSAGTAHLGPLRHAKVRWRM